MGGSKTRFGGPRLVYVDTGAYFALADRKDGNHEVARALLDLLVASRYVFHTSNLVVAETHALMLTRIKPWQAGSSAALSFLADVYDRRIAR